MSSPLSYGSPSGYSRILGHLNRAEQSLGDTYSRLSSGVRINKASDDPAGIAVTSSLKATSRIYAQGVRNINDSISALNVADGAASALANVLSRISELSNQAANGSYSSNQRVALNAEAQALGSEYNRIIHTTKFNGQQSIASTPRTLSTEAGGSRVDVSLKGLAAFGGGTVSTTTTTFTGDGTFKAAISLNTTIDGIVPSWIDIADLNGDSINDIVVHESDAGAAMLVYLGTGGGSFAAGVSYNPEIQGFQFEVIDTNGDSIKDIVLAGAGSTQDFSVLRGNSNGTFNAATTYQMNLLSEGLDYIDVADINNDSYVDVIAGSGGGRVYVRLGNASGTFKAPTSFVASPNPLTGLQLAYFDGDSFLDAVIQAENPDTVFVRLGNGDGTFKNTIQDAVLDYSRGGVAIGDLDNDGDQDIISASGSATYNMSIYLSPSVGTLGAEVNAQTAYDQNGIRLIDLNGDNALDFVVGDATNGKFRVYIGNGNGTFKAPVSYVSPYETGGVRPLAVGDLNGDGVPDVVTGVDNVTYISFANTTTTTTTATVSSDVSFNLLTQTAALTAIGIISEQLSSVSVFRGTLGASQSRLSVAVSNLESARANVDSALSAITDIDVAEEVSRLVSAQVIRDAGQAVLAHSKLTAETVLRLLGA